MAMFNSYGTNYQRVFLFSLTLNSKSLRVAGEVADIEVEVQDFMPQWKNLPKGKSHDQEGMEDFNGLY